MSVNGKLKRREVTRLEHAHGELETEVLEEETLSKNMVFDADGHDFALESEVDCGRVEPAGAGRYAIGSEDGLEVVVFELDPSRRALRPVSWSLDTTERLLFKRFVIEGRASYLGFEWLEP